jgi:Zn2+/Cd2+-exporting ATPase
MSVPLRFRVRGMDCADEVVVLKRELGPLAGGEQNLAFDILNGKMTVAAGLSPEAVVAAVGRTGMKAELWADGAPPSPEDGSWLRSRQTALTITSGILALAGFVWHVMAAGGVSMALGSEGMGVGHGVPGPARVLYALGILAGAWHVLPKASYAARRLRPDMNLLMTIAVLGAVAIGEWFEAATVSFLFALSLALESWSVGRARRAVAALLTLAPPTARLRDPDGSEREVPPADVLNARPR